MKETIQDYEEEHDLKNQSSLTHPWTEDDSKDDFNIVTYTISHLPVVSFMSVFTLLCTWSLTSLTCFHALIVSVAQTTNERVRNVYKDGRPEGSAGPVNPADRGIFMNWREAFCQRIPESRLPKDFSEEVDCLEGRRRRDLAILEAEAKLLSQQDAPPPYQGQQQEMFVDAEENYDDIIDDVDYPTEASNGLEVVYDSERAVKAVASSVVMGIVYSA